MKTLIHLFPRTMIPVVAAICFLSLHSAAQQPINSIVTGNVVNSQVTVSNVKGAGLRGSGGTLFSQWDSTGSSFTVNYSAPSTANILRVSQFTVGSFSSSLITMPSSAVVKIRRAANTDIGDARSHYNFWARYSSIPANGATSGTFDFIAPEIIIPEDAFLLNNLTSGYDNIFQNSVNSPHFGNIERLDFIIPGGVYCLNNTDRLESGVAVIDRGAGDPFKIAAITAINGSNDPVSFGTLVSVSASNFGPDLLTSSFNYVILINDSKHYSESRPSAPATQNLRGVYISLADMGINIGQTFYGYALFGADVTTAAADWTTYPTNSDAGSQLDPVGLMGLYKSPGSLLPLKIDFTASRVNKTAQLQFVLYNEYSGERLMVQRSTDGNNFVDINKLEASATGTYTFIHHSPAPGMNYYRLKMTDKNNAVTYSQVRSVKFDELNAGITIFPNPAVDKLNINFPSSLSQQTITAEVFTSTGDLVKKLVFKNPGALQSIPVNSLPKGKYMLRLTTEKGVMLTIQTFAVI